jgi:uncharacterized protein (DUF983 family)
MLAKESKLYSVLHGTCPACHEGKVFVSNHSYSSIHFTEMHEKCNVCGQAYEPEPGFFQGAMYVSYALTLGVAFVISIVMVLFFNASLWLVMGIITFLMFALLPVIFRSSRMIWLNMFIRYKPRLSRN